MRNNLQTILSTNFNICNKIINYISSLLQTVRRKNCSSMAKENNTSVDELYDVMKESKNNILIMEEVLIQKAKELIAKDPTKASFVFDFTHLPKTYATKIEKLGYDHSGCTNRTEKGISLGVLAIVGENEIIPAKASYWIQKKLAKGEYKSKAEIAKGLIKGAIDTFGLLNARLDGAFSSEDFLKFLVASGIGFVVRMPGNRVVITKDNHRSQLKNNPALKLMRNQREKRVKGTYKSIDNLFFISEKRRRKDNEWETVFLVTNIAKKDEETEDSSGKEDKKDDEKDDSSNKEDKEEAKDFSAKECILFYSKGGAIEKFFRTSKQSLGIGQCQMLDQSKQMAHILATFLAYTFLSQQKIIKQKKCPEDIIHMIRSGVFAES